MGMAFTVHVLHACLRSMVSPSTEINLDSYLADIIENWEIFAVLSYPTFLHLKVFLVI